MKTKALLGLVSLVSAVASQTILAAGHGGGGGGFGGGGFHGGGFGGGHFGAGGSSHFSGAPALRGGGFGGVRYSFGARPTYGRPVYVRPQTRFSSSTVHSPSLARPRNSVSASPSRKTTNSRSVAAATAARPTESAQHHIFARQDWRSHRDWEHRSAHYWNGHWWCWDGGSWIGLDAGFYPWDYFPYYAYDYYPYDYYPGYYADVEPYYNADGVYDYAPAPDPNVTVAQTDLANLGYYHGSIDGIYGKDTRDAVARYQTDHNLAVTGTLTVQTLQSLGVSAAVPS
jgi:Putative peptidoglycan binding domain